MRTKKRLIGAVVVITAAIFAACVAGGPAESTSEQAIQIYPGSGSSGSSWCGSAQVGSSVTCETVTISADVGDSYMLMGIDASNCTLFTPQFGAGDFPVPIVCIEGSGTGAPLFTGASGSTCFPTSYSFTAVFSPAGSGSASCTMYAILSGPFGDEQRAIYFNGHGLAPAFGLAASPKAIAFSDIQINTTSTATGFSVRNTGSTPVTVSVTESNGALFPSNVPSSLLLSNGDEQSFSVACHPTATIGYNGSITFQALEGGSAEVIDLSCNGIDSQVTVTPNPGTFAPTLVGRVPADLQVTIGTTGSVTTLQQVALLAGAHADLTIEGGDVTNGTGQIGSGMEHVVTLRYAAMAVHPAGPLGTLRIQTTAGSRNVAINGEALLGKVAAAPATVDFGPVCVGATATKDFEVYAEAAGTFHLMSHTSPNAPFELTSMQFAPPHQLRGNRANAVTFTAKVSPVVAAAEVTTSVTLQTDLPSSASMPIELRAIALPNGVAATPDAVNFGPNMIRVPTIAKKVVYTNCSSAPINVTAARITGTHANEFAIVSPANPVMTVPQRGSLEFLVVMSPQTNGAKTAQLEVEHDGGTVVAALEGNGFGGDDVGEDEMGTYYTCSAGGAASALPLGLALLALRRRRRR